MVGLKLFFNVLEWGIAKVAVLIAEEVASKMETDGASSLQLEGVLLLKHINNALATHAAYK